MFDDATLRFSNGLSFDARDRRAVSSEIDGFRRLERSMRGVSGQHGRAALCVDARGLGGFLFAIHFWSICFCARCSITERLTKTTSTSTSSRSFNSIYREGFCRPKEGVRHHPRRARLSLSGEWRTSSSLDAVEAIEVQDGRVAGLRLEDGGVVSADVAAVVGGSSETMALRHRRRPGATER